MRAPVREHTGATMFTSRNRDQRSNDDKARATVRGRVAGAAFEHYLEWRRESSACETAYRWWAKATGADRVFAFIAYTAAVDREQQAAWQYENALRSEWSSGNWPWTLL